MKDEVGTRSGVTSSFRLHPSSFDPWLLWQLLDSAFPTGGFAHSSGIEAAWQHGLLEDGDALREFVRAAIRQIARSAAPVALAVRAEPESFERWDRFLDATLTNHVANRASRAQGRALLNTAMATFESALLASAEARARGMGGACHLPVAFGIVAASLGVPPEQCARGFIYMAARGMFSAAVRLGATGPLEAQRLQAEGSPQFEAAAQIALQHPPEQITQTAFMADLLQGTQDRLYSRLFQS
jgi:urease accessory protein